MSYLRKIRGIGYTIIKEDSIYDSYSKYFQFMTTVNMIQLIDFNFRSVVEFNKFKSEVQKSIFNAMVYKKLIKKTKTSELRFKAINSILFSLTKLRAQNPVELQKSIHNKNPRGFFTYIELTERMKVWRTTLNEQLRSGSPSFQLILARSLLNKGIEHCIQESIVAKDALNLYLNEIIADVSIISRILLHPCYESLTIQYLKSKDVLCTAERIINYPGENRPDNVILRYDPDSGYDKRGIFDQNIVNIPDYIKFITVDYTAASNPLHVIEKFDKDYQSEDRYLVIVLLGHKPEKRIKNIKDNLAKKQQKDPDKYKHISILTSEQYKRFLGFDSQFGKEYDLLDQLSFSLLDGSMDALERLLPLWLNHLRYFYSLNDEWILQYFPQDVIDIVD